MHKHSQKENKRKKGGVGAMFCPKTLFGGLFPFLLISFQNLPFWGVFSKEVQSRMRVVHVNKVF